MKRTIAIDLPVLLQGNVHHVDVPLVHDVLGMIKGLKNLEIVLCNDDLQFLYENSDFAFTGNVMKFLSEVKLREYDEGARKEALTYAPDIISGLESDMADAVYLQLCVIHTNDSITFAGFLPRFMEKFHKHINLESNNQNHDYNQ